MRANLILENGICFQGNAFGSLRNTTGEVVFNTAMTGYPESLTDPSYAGQILVSTFPLIGNYGVPPHKKESDGLEEHFEGSHIYANGLVVADYSAAYSHWDAEESLDAWLKKEGIPAITGIDTRALTKLLREKGVMRGRIVIEGVPEEAETPDYENHNFVADVSCKEVLRYHPAGEARKKVVLVDCGCKYNIIRCLLSRNLEVIRVPWNYDYSGMDFDGLFLSNGPGNPEQCKEAVDILRRVMADGLKAAAEGRPVKPIMGICLGNQLLGIAAGARVYKLKYGHRGHNQPVRLNGTTECFITSQNHGYAIDNDSLPDGWQSLLVNMNDGSNEGLEHKTMPWFSVQFHPEANGGPLDTEVLFDRFAALMDQPQTAGKALISGHIAARPEPKPAKKVASVLVLGSGALKIGEAGEFDYSGSQALKALREEGIRTILINPNIATVQTSEGIADKIYFLPVTPDFVERVIKKERPDGIFLSFGGQTALNCGIKLYESGVLERYGVQVLGTPVQTIIDTEDRELFVQKLDQINVKTISSEACDSIEAAKAAAARLGYPVILRSAYALGGLGSGFCDDEAQLVRLAEKSFSFSPQVLVEKSLKGWKEIEYEVVRDAYNNCITVCNMENFDPLGIHTGESIVIAPSQTLSNEEYHFLRELSIRIVRHLGIVGECNVQYAFDPDSEDYRVIEVNARLSRSSALASKATGYPLAFIAAKLGLGKGLFDLKNSVTRTTSAFFEPALDYVVCKIPRWDLGKFHGVDREIGSSMKSVGEVMSIGRTFEEAIQKGLRMIGQGMHGFVSNHPLPLKDLDKALREPTDTRIFAISEAMQQGYSVEKIHSLTKIDRWFLLKLLNIIHLSEEIKNYNLETLPADLLRSAKVYGFSDFQIARLTAKDGVKPDLLAVRDKRESLGIVPFVKQIDTLAGEFPAETNYLYMTYQATEHDVKPGSDDSREGVVVLGSGAYRIGSSVEFDWCCVQAVKTIRNHGYRSVVVNYNPETVSTDYDVTDRLYFDELTFERVLDVVAMESPKGVVVSTGGQIPNNLAVKLANRGIKLMGTSAEDIDHAEDRKKFSSLLDGLGVDQPEWAELTSHEDIANFIGRVGFPVLVRPSYVLSGAAMNICSNQEELERFLQLAATVSQEHPVVVSRFIEEAKEIEFDAVADHGQIIAYAIGEHVEFAGVHSGDATIQFPPQKLYVETVRRIKRISRQIAAGLHISGPFNIQYLAKENDVKVIECNLRASRSFPFVSKVLKINLVELATKVMLGEKVTPPSKNLFDLDCVGIKASQFSFNRLQKADPVLGVDMASTGEVGCIGDDVPTAILESMLSVGYRIPKQNVLLSTGTVKQKAEMLPAARMLHEHGFKLFATGGTSRFLTDNGIPNTLVHWPSEPDKQPQALDLLHRKEIDMVVNIPKDLTPRELTNGYKIRRAAIDLNIPLLTNARLAVAFISAFCKVDVNDIPIKSWEEFA
ncbi:MAG: carbamoyl-phosphate synthase (glutamine-hydrolyzing) large subunit [Bacteroidales bacterium]|nr:carbamoyl-phosphate synthase (glutamine-hydrolyzing) large subunit [Bacteroidales bacterium]